jgi:hypothetical protein
VSFLNFILSLFNVILDGTNNSAELKAVYIFGIALERRLHGMQVFGRSKLIVEWFGGTLKKRPWNFMVHCTGKGSVVTGSCSELDRFFGNPLQLSHRRSVSCYEYTAVSVLGNSSWIFVKPCLSWFPYAVVSLLSSVLCGVCFKGILV